jgi:hypothetical protein
MLGSDADRIHEQVDALLDSEDAMIVLVDGSRAMSYAHGFGTSPDQLELLALEIERAVRGVAGPPTDNRSGRFDRGCNGGVVDRRGERVRATGAVVSDRGIAAGRVLRVAREAVATDGG